jgi:xanthine/uracil permease
MQQEAKDSRSLGELFADLSRETTTLVRQEIRLATTEMTHKATRVGKDIGFLAVGGAVAYAGFLALVAGAILLLGLVIPTWLAAFVVGVVVAVIGYFLVRKGLAALKRVDLAPHQTIETLKEDMAWAKEQTQ